MSQPSFASPGKCQHLSQAPVLPRAFGRRRVAAALADGAALPALVDTDGSVVCPMLGDARDGAAAVSLVMARFAAACGQTTSEAI